MRAVKPWFRETELFAQGVAGYHTYRIPALVVTNEGTLLAFCEGRKYAINDWGEINIVLRRSFDNGASWEDMRVVHADGEHTIGNPCPVVDADTGTVWLAFTWDNDRVFVMRSEDDGNSWSEPREITGDVKLAGWTWYGTGPGHGVQLRGGRLVVPSYHIEGPRLIWPFQHSHIVYSDDHGATWELGGVLGEGTGECEAVETQDGRLYLTMRPAREGSTKHLGAWSDDGGMTWSEVVEEEGLSDPLCQASIVRFTQEGTHDRNRVLFLNPASSERDTMTVRISYDECRTWEVSKVLHSGPSAYSDMAVSPNLAIGCLYERGNYHRRECIRLAQFNIEWLP